MKRAVCFLVLLFCIFSLFAFNCENTFSEEESNYFSYKEPKANNKFQNLSVVYSQANSYPITFFHDDNFIVESVDFETNNRTFDISIFDRHYIFDFNAKHFSFTCEHDGNFFYDRKAVQHLIHSLEAYLTTEGYKEYGITSLDRRNAYEKIVNQLVSDLYCCFAKGMY